MGGLCYTYEYRLDGKLFYKRSSGIKMLSCTYYKNGELKSLTDASGKTPYYEYGSDGRLKYLRGNGTETASIAENNNGSLTSEEEDGRKSEYRYDLLNRQTYVKTLEGKEQENLYDGEGLRVGLIENGKKTTFLYYNGEILAESEGKVRPIRGISEA